MTHQIFIRDDEIVVKEHVFEDRIPKNKIKEAIEYSLEHLPQAKRILLKELGLEGY